ncbi:MAG: carboxypeptidase M32 [Oscillospiraceae bacterium]|nr:carboxypeptidase M32 [Oscillospiraceae bacterium]
MTIEAAAAALTELQEKLSAYSHAQGMIFYDGVTGAPSGTAANRAVTLSVLSAETYSLMTGPETQELLSALREGFDLLDPPHRRAVELMCKETDRMKKIPRDEYVAYSRLLAEADDIWHRAKQTNDFKLFENTLDEIFAANRRFAGYICPDKHPYDYWLNEFEEGLDMAFCDSFFETLRSELVPLIKAIGEKPQIDSGFIDSGYPKHSQEKLSKYLMSLMGIDEGHCCLRETEHPFTTSLGSHFDVRITTKYTDSFCSSMYSVIHEGGHALYMLGVDDSLARTVLDDGASMGFHESQSRFYENLVGRSRPFIEYITPTLRDIFPDRLSGHSSEEIYRAVNKAQPSLIRTEADELTYSLHIMVRYEVERMVMNEEISARDIPGVWNDLYSKYLGVEVPSDTEGCLQDSHWSGGSVGYFPSYSLGSAYGAQFLEVMRRSVDVDGCVASGDLAPINEWNREHIWKHGALYTPSQLLEKILGGGFSAGHYTNYLKKKYTDIYRL